MNDIKVFLLDTFAFNTVRKIENDLDQGIKKTSISLNPI